LKTQRPEHNIPEERRTNVTLDGEGLPQCERGAWRQQNGEDAESGDGPSESGHMQPATGAGVHGEDDSEVGEVGPQRPEQVPALHSGGLEDGSVAVLCEGGNRDVAQSN